MVDVDRSVEFGMDNDDYEQDEMNDDEVEDESDISTATELALLDKAYRAIAARMKGPKI